MMKPQVDQLGPYKGDTRELSNEHDEAQEGLDYPWRSVTVANNQSKPEYQHVNDRLIDRNNTEFDTRAALEDNTSIADLERKAKSGNYTPMSGAARARHKAGKPAKFATIEDNPVAMTEAGQKSRKKH